MVVLVANGNKLPYLKELASVLKENIPGFKTLVVNVNQKYECYSGKRKYSYIWRWKNKRLYR